MINKKYCDICRSKEVEYLGSYPGYSFNNIDHLENNYFELYCDLDGNDIRYLCDDCENYFRDIYNKYIRRDSEFTNDELIKIVDLEIEIARDRGIEDLQHNMTESEYLQRLYVKRELMKWE